MKLMEFMNEERPVSRMFILRIGIIGAFAGACLAVAFMFVTATI